MRRSLPLYGSANAGTPNDVDRDVPQQPGPLNAIWELTLRCDLSCRHCSSRAGKPRTNELSTAEALRVVDELADIGTLEVTLIGGEAYLHEGWLAVIRAVRERGMECTMVTGGRGMTAERARLAHEAGVMSVSVSIDGEAATHDRLRGLVGSHASAIAAMHHLADAGIQVSANTQIGRRNRRELENTYETIADAGVHSWQLQLTVPAGRVVDDPLLVLEPYQLLEVMPAIARIHERARANDIRIWPGNNLGYFGPYENRLRGELPLGHKGSCGAGRTLVGVEADGAIKGCPSLPTRAYTAGNVRDRPLRDIWQSAQPIRFTREDRRGELWGHCASCYYAEGCLGGCSWIAHSLLGRRGNNPFCHHRALRLLAKGRRERVRQVERGTGEPFEHGLFELIEEEWPLDELRRATELVAGRAHWLGEDL